MELQLCYVYFVSLFLKVHLTVQYILFYVKKSKYWDTKKHYASTKACDIYIFPENLKKCFAINIFNGAFDVIIRCRWKVNRTIEQKFIWFKFQYGHLMLHVLFLEKAISLPSWVIEWFPSTNNHRNGLQDPSFTAMKNIAWKSCNIYVYV